MNKYAITIEENGDMNTLGDFPDWIDGDRVVRRVSHIVPVNLVKRAAFHLLRWVFGERGKVATFTRSWQCRWRCTLVDSGMVMESTNRRELIDWEMDQLMEERHTGLSQWIEL